MKRNLYRLFLGGLCVLGAYLLYWVYQNWHMLDVLNPAGSIASDQRNILFFACALSLIVIVPVFILIFFIAWRYRDTNKKQVKYLPKWDHNHKLEAIWWGIPIILILILAVVTWVSSHALDPYKPLASTKKPLTVQVVALDWKWLFIYPEQGVASVGHLEIPEETPINFLITSDAPMNSFWIPKLGGQVYAMAGMQTKLHLIANETGTYNGMSANISGEGFAHMRFTVNSVTEGKFGEWVNNTRHSQNILNKQTYEELAKPSIKHPVTLYSSVEPGLYDTVLMKYMAPPADKREESSND